MRTSSHLLQMLLNFQNIITSLSFKLQFHFWKQEVAGSNVYGVRGVRDHSYFVPAN
jgi:hypothetical protein